MSLLISRLLLEDFRNFSFFETEFSETLTVLVGPNAVGKTNTMEALRLITGGKSLRGARPHEMVRQGKTLARVAARFEGDGRKVDLSADIEDGRRQYRKNGKAAQARDLTQVRMSIPFTPDDLVFSKGSASHRRDEIDAFGSQVSPGYDRVVRAYSKAVEQRNALLKEDVVDIGLLEAWDESLSIGAAALLHHRLGLFQRIASRAAQIHESIGGGERLCVRYVCGLGEAEGWEKEEIQRRMAEALISTRPDDLRRQTTTVGPQRDDIIFEINGRDVRAYGSQGQQRSVVLSWKIAEVLVSHEIMGEQPLLLLDDVMSELDETRRAAMMEFVRSGVQTVVTTTNLGYFSDETLSRAKVVTIDGQD